MSDHPWFKDRKGTKRKFKSMPVKFHVFSEVDGKWQISLKTYKREIAEDKRDSLLKPNPYRDPPITAVKIVDLDTGKEDISKP